MKRRKLTPKQRLVRCFMDGLDWQYELGSAADGNTLYPSVKCLKLESQHSLDRCGIVEVEVRLIRWVQEQKL